MLFVGLIGHVACGIIFAGNNVLCEYAPIKSGRNVDSIN